MLLLLICAIVTLIAGEEHEIVYPRMIVGRSGEKRVLFRAFDQDFNLRLEPTDVLADDFVLMTRDDKGNEVFVKPDIEHWRNRVLQDRVVGSTIEVDEEGGSLKINGVINEKLRIEPSLDHGEDVEDRQGSAKDEVPHRVFKIKSRKSKGGFADTIIPPGVKRIETNITDAQGRQNTVFVVELAVVVDSKHSAMLGSNDNGMRYLIILFNCVNLRFETMRNTEMIIKLVGVKRNNSPLDEPYIVNHIYQGCVKSEDVLFDFGKYCLTHFPGADLCHLICATDIGILENGVCNFNLAGLAYVGGCCDKNGYAVGVSEDSGYNFDGCSTIAHELCHNLGGPHDGDKAPSYLPGSPGAEACPWNDGYAMSYITRDARQYSFSTCSEQCIIYMTTITKCMVTQNSVSTVNVIDNRLPGKYFADLYGSTDQTSYYNRRCNETKRGTFLRQLPNENCGYQCRTPTVNNSYSYWNIPCLDGEPCSATSNKVCKNGICA